MDWKVQHFFEVDYKLIIVENRWNKGYLFAVQESFYKGQYGFGLFWVLWGLSAILEW